MKIERFYDINLAHASYAIISDQKMAVIDPARDPQPYYEFAVKNKAKIIAVIETHPHADFVSSHLEIHRKTDATIYASKLLGADYPHKTFDDGQEIELGKISLKAMNTPGHSPDGISVLLLDESGKEYAVFSGDTLFVGDVGRPDLREKVGNTTAKREALAKQMYHSIHDRFKKLKDEVIVYPAHGAGSLCGKNLSDRESSTIGEERHSNWAFKEQSEEKFVKAILEDQPFVPKYFGYNVDLNKRGAAPFETSVAGVNKLSDPSQIPSSGVVVDVRQKEEFRKGHVPNAINIMLTEEGSFETWLGAIVDPSEKFFLIASDKQQLRQAISRAAKIGYEKLILGALAVDDSLLPKKSAVLEKEEFAKDPENYTVVDVRNESELRSGKIFEHSMAIPLHELRERSYEIPKDKPIVVHCAAGYRSAAASSILESELKGTTVYDLGEAVQEFLQETS